MPPRASSKSKPKSKSRSSSKSKPKSRASSKSRRCVGVTADGSRCKKSALERSDCCEKHKAACRTRRDGKSPGRARSSSLRKLVKPATYRSSSRKNKSACANEANVRCKGMKVDGTQCNRCTKDPYCSIHKAQMSAAVPAAESTPSRYVDPSTYYDPTTRTWRMPSTTTVEEVL